MRENLRFLVKIILTQNATFEKDVQQAIQEVEEKQQESQENEKV